jgi:hypothetical protein
MSIKRRLQRLEETARQKQGDAANTVVFLDERNCVCDRGSAAPHPWAGLHACELPRRSLPIKMYSGFCFGDVIGPPQPRPAEVQPGLAGRSGTPEVQGARPISSASAVNGAWL